MPHCCVPGCSSLKDLHSIPFRNKSTWRQWLKMCPFLLKYSVIRLEYLKICSKHFIPDYLSEDRKLTPDAIPAFHLLPYRQYIPYKIKNGKMSKINPIEHNDLYNFRSVSSLPGQKDDTVEGKSEASLVFLKGDLINGLPVDHSMYCSPSRTEEHLSSSSHCSGTSTELKQDIANLLPIIECYIQTNQEMDNSHLGTEIKEEDPLSTTSNTNRPGYQLDATQQMPLENIDNFKNSKTTDIQHIIKDVEEKLLLEPNFGSLVHEDKDDDEDVMPTDTDSAHTVKQGQSSIYITAKDYKMLISAAPVEKDALQLRIQEDSSNNLATNKQSNENPSALFSNPFYTQCSLLKSNASVLRLEHKPRAAGKMTLQSLYTIPVTGTNKSIENPYAKYNNPYYTQASAVESNKKVVLRLEHKPPSKKITLESLVAELTASDHEETTAIQPSAPVAKNPLILQHSNTNSSFNTSHSDKFEKNDCQYRKENSTGYSYTAEKKLQSKLRNCKRELRKANCNLRRLKKRMKDLKSSVKPFLKAYPLLTPKAKALIDTQLRLAGTKPRAARYSEEERLFALRIYQISPDCYKFLSEYLKLPAHKTLQVGLKNPN